MNNKELVDEIEKRLGDAERAANHFASIANAVSRLFSPFQTGESLLAQLDAADHVEASKGRIEAWRSGSDISVVYADFPAENRKSALGIDVAVLAVAFLDRDKALSAVRAAEAATDADTAARQQATFEKGQFPKYQSARTGVVIADISQEKVIPDPAVYARRRLIQFASDLFLVSLNDRQAAEIVEANKDSVAFGEAITVVSKVKKDHRNPAWRCLSAVLIEYIMPGVLPDVHDTTGAERDHDPDKWHWPTPHSCGEYHRRFEELMRDHAERRGVILMKGWTP